MRFGAKKSVTLGPSKRSPLHACRTHMRGAHVWTWARGRRLNFTVRVTILIRGWRTGISARVRAFGHLQIKSKGEGEGGIARGWYRERISLPFSMDLMKFRECAGRSLTREPRRRIIDKHERNKSFVRAIRPKKVTLFSAFRYTLRAARWRGRCCSAHKTFGRNYLTCIF